MMDQAGADFARHVIDACGRKVTHDDVDAAMDDAGRDFLPAPFATIDEMSDSDRDAFWSGFYAEMTRANVDLFGGR